MIFLYVGVVACHLLACYSGNWFLRALTKPFLIPLLMLLAIKENGGLLPPLLTTALLMGWLGDLALLFRGKKWSLPLGIVFFALGHLLYIPLLLMDSQRPSFFPTILFMLLSISLVAYLLGRKILPKFKGILQKFVFFYMLIILTMITAGICQFLGSSTIYTFLCFLGSILFGISDTILSADFYRPPNPKRSFLVMLTYIGAQTALTFGLLS